MDEEEQKYEAVHFIVKVRPDDGKSWFDIVHDLLTENCTGEDFETCQCGLISMGGCTGTEEQCWKSQGIHESIAEVKTADLKAVIKEIDWLQDQAHGTHLSAEGQEALERLRYEAFWWDNIEQYEDEEEEDV